MLKAGDAPNFEYEHRHAPFAVCPKTQLISVFAGPIHRKKRASLCSSDKILHGNWFGLHENVYGIGKKEIFLISSASNSRAFQTF